MTTTRLLLVRHGETDWSHSRRHTGRTDIPLNEAGEAQARTLAAVLPLQGVVAVWTSPLRRAADTARLAGLAVDRVDPDLVEWDYGAAEGLTTDEVREETPGWDVWTHGVQDGETVYEVGARADRVIARAKALDGTVVLVAHAHLLRIVGARWIGMVATGGRSFTLDSAGWALLGWERDTPVVERWNPPLR